MPLFQIRIFTENQVTTAELWYRNGMLLFDEYLYEKCSLQYCLLFDY